MYLHIFLLNNVSCKFYIISSELISNNIRARYLEYDVKRYFTANELEVQGTYVYVVNLVQLAAFSSVSSYIQMMLT